ncbi:MAG: alkaline phosphatase family protein [Candidatus Tectomicrobia bacterium]|nr:alkaline phosphatase family protein [Candidatus Tectomicrobia bacterium]
MQNQLLILGIDSIVPPMLKQLVAAGRLPNFRRAFAEGYSSDVIPTFPPWTPPGWATVGTGAWPSTHGIEGFTLHFPGEPLDLEHPPFHSHLCRAEYLWEAAARAGRRAIVVKFPGTWPPRSAGVVQVGGAGGYARDINPNDISHAACYTTRGDLPGAIRVSLEPATSWEEPPPSHLPPLETIFVVAPCRAGRPRLYHGLIYAAAGAAYDRLLVARRRHAREALTILAPGAWSRWLEDEFALREGAVTGVFRLKLLELAPDGSGLQLFMTQNHPKEGYTQPPELAAELNAAVGPFAENISIRHRLRGWIDDATLLELWEEHTAWLERTILHLGRTHAWDLLCTQWHPIDFILHGFSGGIDPQHPDYDPLREPYYRELIARTHVLADRLVGCAFELMEDHPGLLVGIMGDHGHGFHRQTVHLNNLLVHHGLLHVEPVPQEGRFRVDWSKSRAYAMSACHIFLNVKGREPEGIVEPGGEYEELRQRISTLLKDLRDPAAGRPIVDAVFRREEMRPWGLYGDGVGDLIYCLHDGYDSGAIARSLVAGDPGVTEDLALLRPTRLLQGFTGEHPAFLPYEEHLRTSLLIVGAGVRRGYARRIPIQMVDIAPTLAYLAGLPLPAQAEGSILTDVSLNHGGMAILGTNNA